MLQITMIDPSPDDTGNGEPPPKKPPTERVPSEGDAE